MAQTRNNDTSKYIFKGVSTFISTPALWSVVVSRILLSFLFIVTFEDMSSYTRISIWIGCYNTIVFACVSSIFIFIL